MVTELLRGRKARIGDGDHGEALQGGGGAIEGGVLGQGCGAREDGAHPAPAVDHVREDPRQRSRPYKHDEGGVAGAAASQVRERDAAATASATMKAAAATLVEP